MAWKSTVTIGGMMLLQEWTAGRGKLSITGARGGTEAVAANRMYAQTGVSGDSHTLSITHCAKETVSDGTTILRVDARVLMETSAYVLRQIGLYAKLVNGEGTDVVGETLLALYQVDSEYGIRVPSSYNPQGFALELSMALRIGTDDTLSLQLDPSAVVSEDDLEDALYAMHPNQLRFVEALYTYSDYSRHGIDEWKSPGTTWTAGRSIPGVIGTTHVFTAPADKYACAIRAGVTENSVVMESWIASDTAYVVEAVSGSGSGSSGGGNTGGNVEEEVIEEEIVEEEGSSGNTGNGVPTSPIDYEMLDGWIFLTCDSMPTGTIEVGFFILV